MQHSLIRFLIISCLFWPVVPSIAEEASLDTLFEQLKTAPDDSSARDYVNEIWRAWFKSGDSKVDELMQEAMRERRSYNYDAAVNILDEVIALKPDYAEGYNQRATVYFLQQSYEKSLIDVAKTLELEPRHFGALSGRAVIRLRQHKPALAVQNLLKAIEIHPFLPERVLLEQINLGI